MQALPARTVRIGSMGRSISVASTTAMATDLDLTFDATPSSTALRKTRERRVGSEATSSLQRLLATRRDTDGI